MALLAVWDVEVKHVSKQVLEKRESYLPPLHSFCNSRGFRQFNESEQTHQNSYIMRTFFVLSVLCFTDVATAYNG
jgi:hypothetical protein